MTIEEALSCKEDIYTDMFHYLLSNLDDNKETFYLSAFTSPIHIADSTLQLDSDIINLTKDLESYINQFIDLRAYHRKLKQEFHKVEIVKREYVLKEEKKNHLENRLQDMANKYNSDPNKRPDLFALCKELANKEANKQKLLSQNERHLKEIENIRQVIFSLQSEDRDMKQLINDCQQINTEQELTMKLESEIDRHLYQIERIYKPEVNDLENLLEEIVDIEKEGAQLDGNNSDGKQQSVISDEELDKRIESVEDRIDASEKQLKELISIKDNKKDNDDDETLDDSDAEISGVVDGEQANLQLALLIKGKNELMKEFQHLSSVFIESNEQLEAIRRANMITIPKKFENLAELCEQPIELIVKAARHKYDDCMAEKKNFELKNMELEKKYQTLSQSYRDLKVLKAEPLEKQYGIVGYFDRIESTTIGQEQDNSDRATDGNSSRDIDMDIDCTIDDNGVVDWNSVTVDIDKVKEKIDELKVEIDKKKDGFNLTILDNLEKEHGLCQANLMKIKEPYDEKMNPIKNKLSEIETTKQKLDGELAELKSAIESKEYLITILKSALENNLDNNNYFNIGNLNLENLERQKRMWLTIETWLNCLE